MKFKIMSVLGTSVRVDTGIASIDVQVINTEKGIKIRLPHHVFIPHVEDFKALSGAVRTEYEKSLVEEIDTHANTSV